MIRCPNCHNKLKHYCTKKKQGQTIRYYKCGICGKSFKTKLFKLVIEKIV